MNERDELRGILANTICHVTNYPERSQPYLLGGGMSTVLDKTADALLTAGYIKAIPALEDLAAQWDYEHVRGPVPRELFSMGGDA